MLSKKLQQNIWWLQVAYMTVSSGFIAILYPHFVQHNVSLGHIVIAEALGYLGAMGFMLAKKQFRSKTDITLGFILVFLALGTLILPIAPATIIIPYTILKVAGAIMFFVPYNILFFHNTKKNKKLKKMTSYWAIGTVVGIIAPITGGFIFSTFGIKTFILLATIILAITLIFTQFINQQTYPYTTKDVLTTIKGVRTITMLDGGIQSASGLLITLYLLNFIQDAFDFGKVLSIIALISVLFSFQLASYSDKNKKRTMFIWPLSILSGAIMMVFPLATTLVGAVALIVAFKFVSVLFNPIRSNILFDYHKNIPINWIARDIYLNLGRFIILGSLGYLAFQGYQSQVFIILGILYMLFPFVLTYKKVYQK